MRETRRKEEYRRAEAVLYKAEGLSYRAIARRMGTSYSAVFSWVRRYGEGGVEALKTKPHPGGKPRITEDQRKTIADTALKSPRLFGYLKNEWSVRLLARHLSSELGINVSKTHVWEILRDLGIVCKRPKAFVKSPDPDYQEKAKKLKAYKRVAPALSKRGLP